ADPIGSSRRARLTESAVSCAYRMARMRFAWLLLAGALLSWQQARGDPLKYEFLLLPSAEAVGTFDRRAPNTQPHDELVQADMLLSVQQGPFKVFGEYLRSDHEGDLERF